MDRMIEGLERIWKEAGGTEVNHENITSVDPGHIINGHLRNATVERCYHASKFSSAVLSNRRALALIIPGRERFLWN